MPIKTFIVDRQEVVRWGLALACSDAVDLEIVGTAESLSSGFDEILLANPDVVIVDFQASNTTEVDYARRILAEQSGLKLLVFSAVDTREIVLEMLNCGAHGYITKDASLAEVTMAVRAVHEGRIFISHSHSTPCGPKSSSIVKGLKADSCVDITASETLSAREREVVLLLAEGLTNKEVAKRLFLSVKTVETYRSRVMKKFQLRGRAELFSFARQIGASQFGADSLVSA